MKNFEEVRQKSLETWADAQRKWLEEQQKNPNFALIEARVNANQNDQAAAAAASSMGSGGADSNLPLQSLQTTTFLYQKEIAGNYYYNAMNHTTGQSYLEIESGLDSSFTYDYSFADSFGYSLFLFTTAESDHVLQYLSPTGEIIDSFAWSNAQFNNYGTTPYYGGGMSLLLYNLVNERALFLYFYNGQIYSKTWADGTYFGYTDRFGFTASKQGTVMLSTFNNIGNTIIDNWVFGPGISPSDFILKDQYTQSQFNYGSDTASLSDSGLYIGTDGRLLNNAGYSFAETWYFIKRDSNDYLTEFEIIGAEYATYLSGWQCLQDLKDALIAKFSTSVNTEELILDNWNLTRSGNDFEAIILDDSTGDRYLCIFDINLQKVDVFLYSDVKSYSNIISFADSTEITGYVSYDNDVEETIGVYSSVGYNISLIDYTTGNAILTSFQIPDTYDGDDLYIQQYAPIAYDSNSITLLAFVNNATVDAYAITVARNSAPIYTKLIGVSALNATSCGSYQCWNDIKDERFTQITIEKASSFQYLLIKTSNRQILSNRVIEKTGGSFYSRGMGFIPVMLELYNNAGVWNVWFLDYNDYTWNLVIDTTATPTTDSGMFTDFEYYETGFQGYQGGSRWIFADPDLLRCWYITSKYGVKQSETLPFAVQSEIGAPWNGMVGQVYSYGENDTSVVATEVSTGLSTPMPFADNFINIEFINDRFIHLYTGDNGITYVDVIIGTRKTTFPYNNVWWVTNDVYFEND